MKMTLSYDMDLVARSSDIEVAQREQGHSHRGVEARTATPGIIHVPRRFVSTEWGGTETVVLETCRRQQTAGAHPIIFTSMALASETAEDICGVPVRRFSYCYPFFGLSADDKRALDKKGGNLLSLSLFAALLTERNVRLYHAHTLKRVGGMVRTAARLRKKPFVVSLHGGIFDVPAAETSSLLKPIENKWEWGKPFGALFGSRRVLEDADMVLCVGESEYEKARRSLPHDRIAHLPNGVACAKFEHGNGASFRNRHGIPQDAFLVLNIGRIDEQKNQMLLLRAFAAMADERPDAHLVFVGPETMPAYAEQMRAFIASHNLQHRVHLLPGLQNSDPALVDAYHACDLFVLTSAHEPFGIVVLEAWSSGKAVITSRVGGLAGLVTEGKTGLFIEPDAVEDLTNKMQHLAANSSLRDQLAEAGRREAQTTYDWDCIAQKQEQCYLAAEANAARRYGRRTP